MPILLARFDTTLDYKSLGTFSRLFQRVIDCAIVDYTSINKTTNPIKHDLPHNGYVLIITPSPLLRSDYLFGLPDLDMILDYKSLQDWVRRLFQAYDCLSTDGYIQIVDYITIR